MNPDELRETTMLRGSRKLKQVTIEDAIQADKLFSILMGNVAQKRKDWIEENVDLELED